MEEISLTCIECPMGCEITVEKNGDQLTVHGNTCPRGKIYAIDEVTCPKRVVTTTVRREDGGVLSVKTAKPVLKEKIFEVMQKINKVVVKLPVRIGDVVAKDISDGVDLVATDNCGE